MTAKEKRREFIKFRYLLMKWKQDMYFVKTVSGMMVNPYYAEIIEMGNIAIAFILQDFQKGETNCLFYALRVITGDQPISPAHRGSIESMAGDWVRWGIKEGHLKL